MNSRQKELIKQWSHCYAQYRPGREETFRQPVGQSLWREWLRIYILQTIIIGAENGLRRKRLNKFVHDERIHAIRAHNKRRDDMHWKSDESADEEWTNARLGELDL